ncbi:MAG TPA: GspH/FimT family pseudopilin [Steroidobacteraceae bacterium]|jgi:type IV fimbrial biogenesis protein FimT
MILFKRTSQRYWPARRTAGFTLLELMISVGVAAILLTIGVPSFRYVTKSNHSSAEINGLLGDMQFARGEAIREGQNVTICASSNGATCNGTINWHDGWIVFSGTSPPGPAVGSIQKIQPGFSTTDTLTADNAIKQVVFSREGFTASLPGAVTFTLHDSTANPQFTRCLSATIVGALSTQIGGKLTAENNPC